MIILKKPVKGVHIIKVPFLYKNYTNNFGSDKFPQINWSIEGDMEGANFIHDLGFHMFASYKAIIENPIVNVIDKKQKIFDWLKDCAKNKFFDLGIVEFSYMEGAFLIFKDIGLNKYISTTSIAPFPAHLHFLGYKTNFLLPGFLPVQNYFSIYEKFQKEYLKLRITIALKNNPSLEELIEEPKILDLFRKSKYYLINVHNIEKYLIPENSKKIVDIAGIEIEIEKIIKEKERKDKIEESFFKKISNSTTEIIDQAISLIQSTKDLIKKV
uniref:Glucuronosyltransferase n=1 Tax=Meloidogyne hapla TaxID=6305 RepID=A0A1I8BN45_MELHA